MDDVIKIFQVFQDCNILQKEVTKTIQNKTKEQKGGFLGMLLGTLEVSLLINTLTGKRMLRAGYGHGKGVLRAGYENKMGFECHLIL